MSLDHPNITKTIKWFKEKTFKTNNFGKKETMLYCIVMEYEREGSLLDELKKSKKYKKEELLRIAQDITSGLCYLNSIGLIHRDIKPHNILISKGRRMKLCDLEFLKEIDHSKHTTLVGHRGYMAPEFNWQDGKYTEKIDIWSFGMTILQLYIGHSIDNINSSKMEYMEQLKSFDIFLSGMVDKCLIENPDKRISALKLNNMINLKLKDFFEMKSFQYCFLTTPEGKILYSKYIYKERKNYEIEIEKQIKIILKNDLKVIE